MTNTWPKTLPRRFFEKALMKFGSYDADKAMFSTWIFAIARNTLIDHYRVKDKEKKAPLELA